MNFKLGLQTDNNPRNQQPGSWRDARNLVVSTYPGSLTSEPGFTKLFEIGKAPIGSIELGDGRTVVFSLPSEIGILDSTSYTTILRDTILGFDINYPITGEFQRTIRGEEIISWTDNHNPPRLLNLTKLGFELNSDFSLVNPNDIAVSQLFAPALAPRIELTNVSNGGQLIAGTYSYVVCYEDKSGFVTRWSPVSRYVPITDDSGGIYTQVDGVVGGSPTNRSVQLELNNLDTRYAYVRVAAIQRTNQVLTAYQFTRVAITGSRVFVTHTGGENKTTLTTTEVLTPTPEYTQVRTMTQLQNELFLGGLLTRDSIDYQKYANNITLNYIDHVIDIKETTNSYKNPKNTFYFRPFLHDEVYSFYLVFHLKSGLLSDAFHIPGRAPNFIDESWNTGGLVENDRMFTLRFRTGLSYLGEDEGLGPNVKYFQTRDTSNNSQASSNMGFWENENEFYPDEEQSDIYDNTGKIGTLRNVQVRHHRFPSLRDHDGYTRGSSGEVKVLGVRLDNVYIPPNISDQVVGYEVFYAKRTLSNSTVLGQSLAYFASSGYEAGDQATTVSNNDVSTTGGNWNYSFNEASTPDKLSLLRNNYIRVNPPDALYTNSNITPTHITHQALIGKRAIIRRPREDKEKPSLLIEINHLLGQVDGQEYGATTNHLVKDENYLRAVSDVQLLTQNTDPSGVYNNIGGEQCYVMKIKTDANFHGLFDYATRNNPAQESTLGFVNDFLWTSYEEEEEEYNDEGRDVKFFATKTGFQDPVAQYNGRVIFNYLTNLNSYKTDVYVSYRSQDLVGTGFVSTSSTSVDTYGGDSYFSNYGYRVTAPNAMTVIPVGEYQLNPDVGTKVLYNYAVESTMNLGLRHIDPLNQDTVYYPKIGSNYLDDFLDLPLTRRLSIGYNNDYTSVNDLTKAYAFVPNQYVNKFLTRIIRSRVSQSEELTSSWKRFPVNDYYEMPRNRGVITNLATLNDRLLIHHEQALYRTLNKLSLDTDETKVTLGSGDIFTIPPEELVYSKSGYAGTIFQHACLVTKLGYFFPSQSGKVFLLSDKLSEISNLGLANYFRELLFNERNDNPYNNLGISTVFDEWHNRILLTFLGNHKDVTLSYSGDIGNWVSTHDYLPPFYTSSGDNLLSIKDGSVYAHVGKPGTYYSDIVYPFSLDFVVNPSPDNAKLHYQLNWRAEYTKLFTEPIDKLLVYNHRQNTNYLEVSHLTTGRLVEQSYYFNSLRDAQTPGILSMSDKILSAEPLESAFAPKPWFKMARLVGNYMVVRLVSTNKLGEELSLHSAELLTRPSNRL